MKVELTYPKITVWLPSKVNNKWQMTRLDLKKNHIEVREMKWWEKIIYLKF